MGPKRESQQKQKPDQQHNKQQVASESFSQSSCSGAAEKGLPTTPTTHTGRHHQGTSEGFPAAKACAQFGELLGADEGRESEWEPRKGATHKDEQPGGGGREIGKNKMIYDFIGGAQGPSAKPERKLENSKTSETSLMVGGRLLDWDRQSYDGSRGARTGAGLGPAEALEQRKRRDNILAAGAIIEKGIHAGPRRAPNGGQMGGQPVNKVLPIAMGTPRWVRREQTAAAAAEWKPVDNWRDKRSPVVGVSLASDDEGGQHAAAPDDAQTASAQPAAAPRESLAAELKCRVEKDLYLDFEDYRQYTCVNCYK